MCVPTHREYGSKYLFSVWPPVAYVSRTVAITALVFLAHALKVHHASYFSHKNVTKFVRVYLEYRLHKIKLQLISCGGAPLTLLKTSYRSSQVMSFVTHYSIGMELLLLWIRTGRDKEKGSKSKERKEENLSWSFNYSVVSFEGHFSVPLTFSRSLILH